MARGAHRSPQFPKFGKRAKTQKKQRKLIENNQAILALLKNNL